MKKKCGVLPMVALAAFVGCGGDGDVPPSTQAPVISDGADQAAMVDGTETPDADATVTFVSLKVPNMT